MRFPSVQDMPSIYELEALARKAIGKAPAALRTVRKAAQDIVAGAELLEQAVERVLKKRRGDADEAEDIAVRDERDGRKV